MLKVIITLKFLCDLFQLLQKEVKEDDALTPGAERKQILEATVLDSHSNKCLCAALLYLNITGSVISLTSVAAV